MNTADPSQGLGVAMDLPEPPPCPATFGEAQAQQGPRGSFQTGSPLPEGHMREAQIAQSILSQIPNCTYPQGYCEAQTHTVSCDNVEASFTCTALEALDPACPTEAPGAQLTCDSAGLTCAYRQGRFECLEGVFTPAATGVLGAGVEDMYLLANCPKRM